MHHPATQSEAVGVQIPSPGRINRAGTDSARFSGSLDVWREAKGLLLNPHKSSNIPDLPEPALSTGMKTGLPV